MKVPIFIWYDGYPPHQGDNYKERVSRVREASPHGLASLNLTNVTPEDQGWYECKVFFLNRSPESQSNGTWVHLDVHGKFEL